MSIYHCENVSNSSDFGLLEDLTKATEQYAILGIAIIGMLFNALSLAVLQETSLAHSFYDFLCCRCFCNLFLCLVGLLKAILSGWELVSCLRQIVILLSMRTASFASIIADNLMMFNRFVTLYDWKTSLFYKMSKRVNLLICFSFSFVLFTIPLILRLKYPNMTDDMAFKACIFTLILISSCTPAISLIVLNTISLFKFKRLMKEKKKFSIERRRINKANVRFTRLVVALTFICIVTQVFETIAFTFNKETFLWESFSQESTSLINFLFEISTSFLIASHSLDSILYFVLDKQLRRRIRRIFGY